MHQGLLAARSAGMQAAAGPDAVTAAYLCRERQGYRAQLDRRVPVESWRNSSPTLLSQAILISGIVMTTVAV